MTVYLTAGADSDYEISAYAFKVGNLPTVLGHHVGWTVVEAYYHGLIALSHYIIYKKLYVNATGFVLCTPSKAVKKLVTTEYLEQLHKNSWKSPDGDYIFYLSLLKELYYHRIFYKERTKKWSVLTELSENVYQIFESCQAELNDLIIKEDPHPCVDEMK